MGLWNLNSPFPEAGHSFYDGGVPETLTSDPSVGKDANCSNA